ncbi:MAG: hypothetical protein U0703_07225 [Anaerolineae bacterium]
MTFDVGAQPAEAAQLAYGSDEDLLAALGLGEGDVDEQAVEASLPQWTDQPEAAAVEDEDVFAALGMGDDELKISPRSPPTLPTRNCWRRWGWMAATPKNSPPKQRRFRDGRAGRATRFADMDFETMFGSADLDDVPPAASEEDLLGQWAAQTDDELPQTEDFYAALGMSDDETSRLPPPKKMCSGSGARRRRRRRTKTISSRRRALTSSSPPALKPPRRRTICSPSGRPKPSCRRRTISSPRWA